MTSQDFDYNQLPDLINKEMRESVAEIGQCNILIIGKSGVGKSTLINAIFRKPLAKTGVGKPITPKLRKYSKQDFPLTVRDTQGLELKKGEVQRIKQEVSHEIAKNVNNAQEQIHIIWYCVSEQLPRIEDEEIDWINSLHYEHNIPIVLVVTQTYDPEEPSDFLKELKSYNLDVSQMVSILAVPKRINSQVIIPEHGLDTLVNVTMELLPKSVQAAFANATKSIELKARKAREYIRDFCAPTALAICSVPVPWPDAMPLGLLQVKMITYITTIFGLPTDQQFIATVVSSITGVAGATLIGRSIVTNLVKIVPVGGTVLGTLTGAATASAITTALGIAYIEALKRYTRAELEGQQMSLQTLSEIIHQQYRGYDWKKQLNGNDDDDQPRDIPIS